MTNKNDICQECQVKIDKLRDKSVKSIVAISGRQVKNDNFYREASKQMSQDS